MVDVDEQPSSGSEDARPGVDGQLDVFEPAEVCGEYQVLGLVRDRIEGLGVGDLELNV